MANNNSEQAIPAIETVIEMKTIEAFLAEVEKMVEEDRPWYYGDGHYHRTCIYDGEIHLLSKMKKLYDEQYKAE